MYFIIHGILRNGIQICCYPFKFIRTGFSKGITPWQKKYNTYNKT